VQDSKDHMRNLKMILSYDGAEFSGWQVQPDAITVQGTLASAIGRVTGEKVLPQGSGRTDAGVHALAQVVTFVTESSVPTENFVKALNDILPASVRVLEVVEVPAEFHARHSALAKTYRYRMYRGASVRPFWRATFGIILIRSMKRQWGGQPAWSRGRRTSHHLPPLIRSGDVRASRFRMCGLSFRRPGSEREKN
jgi:Pseudouridylate synthase